MFQFLSLIILMLVSCSHLKTKTQVENKNSDFFILKVSGANKLARQIDTPVATCADKISKAICVSDATDDEIFEDLYGIKSLSCDSNGKDFLKDLLQINYQLPKELQPYFCSLSKIYISDSIPSVAFATGIVNDSNDFIGTAMGIKKSALLNSPKLDTLVTWKEQLNFGGSSKFLSIDKKLPQLHYGWDLTGFQYVLTHEMGHIVDFTNKINPICYFSNKQEGCDSSQYSWYKFSWSSDMKLLPESKFLHQENLCYYDCNVSYNAKIAEEVFTSMRESSFITPYSGMNVFEDFAEFLTWYFLLKDKTPDYKIFIPENTTISMKPIFSNLKIREKLNFIGKHLDSKGVWAK